jgi:1-acyl-sn-glycerol-3-phosphate acyltransferase
MSVSTILLALGAGVLVWLFLVRRQIGLMQKSGYLPWRRYLTGMLAWRALIPIIAHLFVGPVHVRNRENITKVKGRRVFVPNHTFELDFNIAAVASGAHFYYLTLTNQLRGLRGWIGARTGAIPVNTAVENGGAAAAEACVKALAANRRRSLLIYPQGGLKAQWPLNKQEFKSGAVRIAQSVYQLTGEEVWIVPMGTCYLREREQAPNTMPGKFVRRCRKAFGVTNYGAIVVVGEPIAISTLPAEADAAIDEVFKAVELLVAQAMGEAEAMRTKRD